MADPIPSPPERLEQLRSAIDDGSSVAIDECLEAIGPAESARAVSRLSDEYQTALLKLLPNDDAAELVEALPEPAAAQMLEHLEPAEAAAIITEMASDEQADLMGACRGRMPKPSCSRWPPSRPHRLGS